MLNHARNDRIIRSLRRGHKGSFSQEFIRQKLPLDRRAIALHTARIAEKNAARRKGCGGRFCRRPSSPGKNYNSSTLFDPSTFSIVELRQEENGMPIPLQEVQDFSRFVADELRREQVERSLEDYLRLWREAHERNETVQAIHEGMQDVRSGRTRPAAEVLSDIRRELGST
jgi:hypothetical protein